MTAGRPATAGSSTADRPTISIVTACYNSTAFIDRIHSSLAQQTYRRFEWICVDDCSSDGTVERLARLEAPGELGMQVYLLPQNTGGPVALAVGTQRSKGDVVIWLDHDDELFPFALEKVRDNWPQVERDEKVSGLTLRAQYADGSPIGRPPPPGLRITSSEGVNRHPDVSDGTLAIRGDLMRRHATVEAMEEVALNGAFYLPLTAHRPVVTADAPPIRFYHRDNPSSQTLLERVSRKTVASYARIIDAADRYFLLSPRLWARHLATMLRYSKLVHGRWFTALRHIRRPGIRLLAVAAWPLGLLAYWRRPHANVVEIPLFRPEQAEGLPNLWKGPAG